MKRLIFFSCCLATASFSETVNIVRFGAKGDGTTLNTQAIQRAIDSCRPGDAVEIPPGVFLSGALFLKSDLTLQLLAGAVLEGSQDPRNYEPFIRNRFEGWEMDTYASLINAGQLDHSGAYNVHNLKIHGQGTIRGGGQTLARAMITAKGMRSRGRLICIMNCNGLDLEGITVEESPSWTIHYIYSQNVTCRGLTIKSSVENGDGIDPDSSRNCSISQCSFATGDDCIAIKSGKNPEGGTIGIPTENVQINDCKFISGHGISIGSEMSGGIRNILVENCSAGNLKNGLQIKGTRDRGGVVEGITVRHCDLQKIRVLTAVGYNNDGAPAPAPPYFRSLQFVDINLSHASTDTPVIIIDGFDNLDHRTSGVTFTNILLPAGARLQLDQCRQVTFTHTVTTVGKQPLYQVTRSEQVTVVLSSVSN